MLIKEDISWQSKDGLNLYAQSIGSAEAQLTVLCMHGLTRNHKDFNPMIQALGDRYRYIAVDVRGRGRSERDPQPKNYSPTVYAADMVTLLDHLQLQSVVLIGTSMGGLMSMLLSRMIPNRLRGIVLNDIGPVIDQSGLERIATYVGEVRPFADWEAAAENIARIQAASFPGYGSEQWMAFARRTCHEIDSGEVLADYDPQIAKSLGNVKPGLLTRLAMWRLFKSMYKRPLLIIRGETSDILSQKTLHKMIRRHPNASTVTVPGVGHAPLLDEPEAVAAISGFLKGLEADA